MAAPAEPPSSPKSSTPVSSKGWDGKFRVERQVTLSNPEALSDPEYSDPDDVLPGEQIAADEGTVMDKQYRGSCIEVNRSPR